MIIFTLNRWFISGIYPTDLQLNKANASDTEAVFLDLNLSINNDKVPTKIYDKQDDFDFDIVNFPILNGDVPLGVPLMAYIFIYQLNCCTRASSHVSDFNSRYKFLTVKLLKQGYRYYNKKLKVSSFKSSDDVNENENGPYRGFGY